MVKKSLVMKNGKSEFDQINLQPLPQSQGIAIGLMVERCKLTSSIVTKLYACSAAFHWRSGIQANGY